MGNECRGACEDRGAAGEIQRALEAMRRVRLANVGQTEKALTEITGNTYTLPKPPTFPASGSHGGDAGAPRGVRYE